MYPKQEDDEMKKVGFTIEFGKTEDEKIENMKYKFTTLKEFDEKELLSMEKEMLGIYISGHPLEKIKEQIKQLTSRTVAI